MVEHSPTPWRVIKAFEDEPARIIDADDDEVAVELIDADAAYIVEVVNAVDATHKLQRTLLGWSIERDRLRNIMRGLVAILDTITLEDHEIALLDEAREAIKEEKP